MFQTGQFGFLQVRGSAQERLQPGWAGGGLVESISHPELCSGTMLGCCRTCACVRWVPMALGSGELVLVVLCNGVMDSTEVL